jgi:predicted RNA polymerase sigma factor
MALLSRAVTVAQVRGPQLALIELDAVADFPGLVGHHLVDALRAHLAELAVDPERQSASSTCGPPSTR